MSFLQALFLGTSYLSPIGAARAVDSDTGETLMRRMLAVCAAGVSLRYRY
jgi:hypothetical protein